jgi:hypothetical protein
MTLYEQVLNVSKTYLGPAAEQFISRQCQAHLNKSASDLANADLTALAKWMEIGAGLLMDPTKAKELAVKVKGL